MYLTEISVCAIICIFFDNHNFNLCSSSFYLSCFFFHKYSLLSSLFLLFYLNISTNSSHYSSVLSWHFSIFYLHLLHIEPYVVESSFFHMIDTIIVLPFSYNYFSGPTCVAWYWWCPRLYLLCNVHCIFPCPFHLL